MDQATALLLFSNLFIALGILFLFWKDWLSSLKPDWFYIFNVFEHDFLNYEEYKLFLPIKGNHDNYVLKGSEYSKKDVKPYINSKGVYTWNFTKGQNKPILFYGTEDNIDGKMIAEVKKFSMDDIWFGGSGLQDFIQTYGLIVLAIIIFVLFIYLINQNQTTMEVLKNVSVQWRR